jgi:hypothetical protein
LCPLRRRKSLLGRFPCEPARVEAKCAVCGRVFTRAPRQFRPGQRITTCSPACSTLACMLSQRSARDPVHNRYKVAEAIVPQWFCGGASMFNRPRSQARPAPRRRPVDCRPSVRVTIASPSRMVGLPWCPSLGDARKKQSFFPAKVHLPPKLRPRARAGSRATANAFEIRKALFSAGMGIRNALR